MSKSYKLKWNEFDGYLCGVSESFTYKNKLAMFDLDGTLIEVKSGKKFPISENDWKFKYDNTIKKILELSDDNYSVIIISNQGGIEKKHQDAKQWMNKIDNICDKLKVDILALCSTGKNKFRKPYPTFFNEHITKNVKELDIKKSFYCGDAVGRKTDFSDTDLKFAINCKVNFYIPEHIFLNEKNIIPKIDYPELVTRSFEINFRPNKNQEMIIMVGFQGSGKSLVAKYISDVFNYKIINQDTLKTQAKCKKECEKYISENQSVIIDATNASDTTRKIWIDIARLHKYKVRIIKMKTSESISLHNNCYRYYKKNIAPVPKVAYNIYKSKYKEPSKKENIEEILEYDIGAPNDPDYFMYFDI